jgi:hypothetical protein
LWAMATPRRTSGPERRRLALVRRVRHVPRIRRLHETSSRGYGVPPVLNQSPHLLLTAALILLNGAFAPSAAAQTQDCPLAADSDISTAVGSVVHVSPFFVVDSGSAIQCLFQGDAVGDGVLVGRYPNFFSARELAPFGADQDVLRFLLPDGLTLGTPLTLTPVDGIGDAATWVVPVDPSTAPDSLGRLLVRRGTDAFVIGTQNGPGAVDAATSVAKALLAAST